MKVKEHGSKFINGDWETWSIDINCAKFDEHDEKGCGAKLKIVASDLKWRYWEGSHFNHYYLAVQCPECGKFTRVSTKLVPPTVFAKLDKAAKKHTATFDGFSDRE